MATSAPSTPAIRNETSGLPYRICPATRDAAPPAAAARSTLAAEASSETCCRIAAPQT